MKTFLLICLLSLFIGCSDEQSSTEGHAKANQTPSSFTVGIGEQSFEFDQCIVRKGTSPKRIQLVAESKESKPRMHLEFSYTGEGPLLNEKLQPSLFVLALKSPLATDEDPVYENKDLKVIISLIDENKVQGRIRGRVSDLLLGRPHEIRGRFSCGLDH
jgi:hypothetical protein